MKLRIFVLAICFMSIVVAEDKLYFVFTLVSQGTITPDCPIPTKNWEDWEEKGPNELTAMGMREQYLLGHELRRRYSESKFIDFEYVLDQVYLRMMEHGFTMMSGQAFLRGFLGDNLETLTDPQLAVPGPPIPVEPYFKEKIGNKVLPFGIGTLPFHNYYPHPEDVFAPHFCRYAQKLNAKKLQNDVSVKEILKLYEAGFLEIARSHYKMEVSFPGYISLLESIASAIHQRKEMSLNETETILIKNFYNALYYPSRTLSDEANLYRLSGIFDFLHKHTDQSLSTIMKNPTGNQNQRACFIFTKDIMLASLLKIFKPNDNNAIGSATIISFEVYGPEQDPTLAKLNVKVRRNDEEPMKTYATFNEFLKGLSDLIKKDYKEKCQTDP